MTVRPQPTSRGTPPACPEPAPPPYHGSLEILRQTAVEQLRLCAQNAHLAADQGDLEADAGLTYNSRRAWIHFKAAADAMRMMAEHRDRHAAPQNGRQP